MIGLGTQIHRSTTMAEDVAMMVRAPLVVRSTETIAAGEETRILGLKNIRVGAENIRVGKRRLNAAVQMYTYLMMSSVKFLS